MPIFRGKAKLNLGGPVQESNVHSKQNYDFSGMNMSTAAAKSTIPREHDDDKEGEDRPQRRPRPQEEDTGFGSDDGFETVTEKKRITKPQFTRGSNF